MRVIAGTARGTKLSAVPGDTTRPILDRVKTSLFDIIREKIQGKKFLDLFGGSGSVGIEALSQGAAHCTFLDIEPSAIKVIKTNITNTHFENKSEVRQMDAFSYLRNVTKSFDIIYVAPPQYKNMWLETVQTIAERPQLISEYGMMIVQIDPKEFEPVNLASFTETDRRKYGNTEFLFFNKI